MLDLLFSVLTKLKSATPKSKEIRTINRYTSKYKDYRTKIPTFIYANKRYKEF